MSENFYQKLSEQRQLSGQGEDSPELKKCIEETVEKLIKNKSNFNKPGMLLGKVQSGKTRAYLGIIALAFDNNYDIAIILQKGTKALLKQTFRRIKEDYKKLVQSDMVQVFDIMNFPDNLTGWELQQKIVIVAKKQTDNLDRVMKALSDTYPNLKDKKILIVDDEADFASLCFRRNSQEDKIEQGKISSQIDELRNKVADSDYLEVTATPYSLYLQPDENEEQNELFIPKRPAFTTLVPTFKEYIGGDYYFLESENENSPAHFVFNEISTDERNALEKEDRRSFRIEDVLSSSKIKMLRSAILNFIVGACIRRIQQEKMGVQPQKYSFIIHTERRTSSHDWQINIVEKLESELVRILQMDVSYLDKFISAAHNNLSKSINTNNGPIVPDISEIKEAVYRALKEGQLSVVKVNCKKEVEELLDEESGQLKLRAPLNIFVGGQILDRGVTIENLIGFYYGRNPKKFQQDTVLQHSRMYGKRDKDDLKVTRFYTTLDVYQVMKKIHEFDSELRKVLEEKGNIEQQGVYFIRKDDSNKLIPCSPNKILMSNITTLKPRKRLLPVGFQTGFKTHIKPYIEEIDRIISDLKITEEKPYFINLEDAQKIIDLISKTLEFEKGYEWDSKAFLGSMEYLSLNDINQKQRRKILLLVSKDRNLSRIKSDGGFSDAPDTKTEVSIAEENAIDTPMLMLFRENGAEPEWRGSPFWWPVLYVPKNVKTVIFASEIME